MVKKQKDIEIDDKTVYHFCGDGQCIPGLPHEVTAVQARALGLLEVLEAALRNGNYSIKPTEMPAAKTTGEGA
jgi:hypothetical protein